MKKPRVTVNCVANRYAGAGERIVEFSFADGTGGLVSFVQTILSNTVVVYNVDPGVEVRVIRAEP